MKPKDMRAGDRILMPGMMIKRKIVEYVEEVEASPGMAEWTYICHFTDGSSTYMARNKDYQTWY